MESCLNSRVKKYVVDLLEKEVSDLEDNPKNNIKITYVEAVKNSIENLPECGVTPNEKPKSKNKKRKLSPYNIHMSECMKKGKDFSNCVIDWKKLKKNQ